MSKALKSVTVWIAGTAVVLTLAACSSTPDEETPAPASSVSTMESQPPEALEPEDSTQPINPDEDLGEQQTFDGEGMMVETITANNMEIEVPKGIRIPETALVTEATKSSIMMADDDPAAITDMINTSAEEAGYEVYAEVPGGKVFVGSGNAILFTASPQAQMITWGPEAMKDLLAGN